MKKLKIEYHEKYIYNLVVRAAAIITGANGNRNHQHQQDYRRDRSEYFDECRQQYNQ
jgi:hypothetical protein